MSPAGRPEIGQPINIRLGDELLAAVDAKAARLGASRAKVIRTILADVLAGDRSFQTDMAANESRFDQSIVNATHQLGPL